MGRAPSGGSSVPTHMQSPRMTHSGPHFLPCIVPTAQNGYQAPMGFRASSESLLLELI